MKIHLDTETKTIYVYEAKLVELLDLIHSIDSEHREEWVVKDSTLRITAPFVARNDNTCFGEYKGTGLSKPENTNEYAGIFAGSTNVTNITNGYPTGSSISYTGVLQDHPPVSGSYTFTRYPNGTASYTGVNPSVSN